MKQKSYKRIAVEESWMPTELFDDFRALAQTGETRITSPGLASLWGEVMQTPGAQLFREIITDINTSRLENMDAAGIDMQILSITAPGVQIYEKEKAVSMARFCNDVLADGVKKHPGRLAALAAVAPQDPNEAAKELDRCIGKLGMKGVIINSHTFGEYLDDPKFWPIFEAAQSLGVPLYLHPSTPAASMISPYIDLPLEGAIWGFAADCGLHALRLITAGVFDQFPDLKIVLGHLGEGIPWFLNRIDHQYGHFVLRISQSPRAKKLKKSPREYFLNNFYITTSGMNWEEEIMYCRRLVGADRVLFAADYPFESMKEDVGKVDRLPLPEDEMRILYQTNAEKVFGL
ncbi:amidohydrolase family protein [Salidesulfovibrio onnuriiensis]|uniref:amidohydrolase family protein n=1 Tax=Salidesulfovibrio onnuriiensis TaxID=2583823 RepID=UPI0011C98096|nr:amidohydrolase family protein [Salidesulfovibrio onnuriiensis]